ncbi:hypothetical protein NDU88_002017 [Pleurodeles waltl]|uniref:Uncharacterized protein n=1 Tax=Pleurodeles waltl TaxID=8319 RepID=A0AAV7MM48_PLEWA|nr:hypothetical protein NDU88_002017 [Pleurodeles waltl]
MQRRRSVWAATRPVSEIVGASRSSRGRSGSSATSERSPWVPPRDFSWSLGRGRPDNQAAVPGTVPAVRRDPHAPRPGPAAPWLGGLRSEAEEVGGRGLRPGAGSLNSPPGRLSPRRDRAGLLIGYARVPGSSWIERRVRWGLGQACWPAGGGQPPYTAEDSTRLSGAFGGQSARSSNPVPATVEDSWRNT